EAPQACVFFNEKSNLLVLSRDGSIELLMVSPFSNQLDKCLVYLDEVHTRGVDLRLPTTYRAAVTLGPSLTKDRLVQACMRMRKLGKGQSIMFCAPKEVQRKIRAIVGKNSRDDITFQDVLKWTIKETVECTTNSVPLWATQGVRYQRRMKITLEYQTHGVKTEDGDTVERRMDTLQEFASALEEP